MLAAELGDLRTRLQLLHNANDLLFGVPLPGHPEPPVLLLYTRKLSYATVYFSGGRSPRRARRAALGASLLLLGFLCPASYPAPALAATQPAWDVRFSPRGGCTQLVVDTLNHAQHTVLVQAYSFTSAPIAKALVEAHKRGVHVEVILDKGQRTAKYSSADFVAHAGIATYIDAKHAIAHNKVMVIDDEIVITGSFNFTTAAEERNAENLLVLRDNILVAEHQANWQKHRAHSEPYVGR